MTVLSHNAIYALARWAGCNNDQAIIATAIAPCESDDDTTNIGDQTLAPYGSDGLFQLFTGAHSPAELQVGTGPWTEALRRELFDPFKNSHAMWIVSNHGRVWQPWSTYNNGCYKQWLSAAKAASKAVGDNWSQWLPGAVVTQPAPTPAPAPSPGPNPVPQPVPGGSMNPKDRLRLRGNKNPHGAKGVAQMAKWHANGTTFPTGHCQQIVRTAYGAPFIGHGTAQVEWLSCPEDQRHTWYNPPAGVPVHWSGGSSGDGHVAIADGRGNVWSSDIRHAGKIDLVTLGEVHANWGNENYEGWKEIESGLLVWS